MDNSQVKLSDFKALPNHLKALLIYEEGNLISSLEHNNTVYYLFWVKNFYVEVLHHKTLNKILTGTAFNINNRLIKYCNFDLNIHLPENISAGYWDNTF
jgi:hypothetical protein